MKLSVIIPAHNEEKRIQATLLDVHEYLKKQPYDYEVIVVVNNSNDKTYDIASSMESASMSKVVAINLREGGKGNAVKRGIIEKAGGDIIMFMDADNATPVNEIEKFFPYFDQGYEVIIGSRYTDPSLVKNKQPIYRIVLSRLSNILIQFLAVPGIKDTQLGFKAFQKKAAFDIFPLVSIHRWGFDIEVMTIALAHGFKIKEVGVSWTENGGGHVPLKAYAESLADLLKIKINSISGKYYTPKPRDNYLTEATMRDYDLAGLSGFLSGLFLIPVAQNLGLHHIFLFIFLPFIMAAAAVSGIWIGKSTARRLPIMFQLSKFAAVGILNTAINFGILNIASIFTGVTSGLAVGGFNIPATVVAASNSYVWNKYWVFKKNKSKGFLSDAPSFVAVTVIGIIINSMIVFAFTTYLNPVFGLSKGAWLNVGEIIATLVGIAVYFLGYKFIAFRIAPKQAGSGPFSE
ncbi:glycosyltransferase [Patescibacteria group bacterium]|nr:glycosyltransferase [Patescibacteria group bacterium]